MAPAVAAASVAVRSVHGLAPALDGIITGIPTIACDPQRAVRITCDPCVS